jgi:putative flippase GtrA
MNTGTDAESGLRSIVRRHAEKVRYLLVGAWNTVFGYGLFLLLLALLTDPLRSLGSSPAWLLQWIARDYYVAVGWIGWVIAVPHSTLTMKYLAFRSPGHPLPQIGKAYLVYVPTQLIGSFLLWLTVSVLGLTPQIGALVTVAVTTVASYLGHKYFTFKGRHVVEAMDAGEAFEDGETGA